MVSIGPSLIIISISIAWSTATMTAICVKSTLIEYCPWIVVVLITILVILVGVVVALIISMVIIVVLRTVVVVSGGWVSLSGILLIFRSVLSAIVRSFRSAFVIVISRVTVHEREGNCLECLGYIGHCHLFLASLLGAHLCDLHSICGAIAALGSAYRFRMGST